MKKEKKRLSMSERRPLELPEEIYGGGPFVELRGRREVCVQGCRKILTCTEDVVRLDLREAVLAIRGQQLNCITYFAGAVAVRGWIVCIGYEEGDK